MAVGQNQPEQAPGQSPAESPEGPVASGLIGLAILAGGIALLTYPPLTLLLVILIMLWTIAPFAVFPWALWQELKYGDGLEEYDDEVDRLAQRGLRDDR